MKKYRILILLFILIAVIIAFLLGIRYFKQNSMVVPKDIVAYVDNEPISKDEISLCAEEFRSEVIAYFYNTYKAEQDENFWSTSFDGEVPANLLRDKAFSKAVEIKVQQIMCKEIGIVEDISYETFKKELKTENKRRQNAVSDGEPIYGPEQYSEASYYTYLHNNRLLKLKSFLNSQNSSETKVDYSDENFLVEYEKRKEEAKIKTEPLFDALKLY